MFQAADVHGKKIKSPFCRSYKHYNSSKSAVLLKLEVNQRIAKAKIKKITIYYGNISIGYRFFAHNSISDTICDTFY